MHIVENIDDKCSRPSGKIQMLEVSANPGDNDSIERGGDIVIHSFIHPNRVPKHHRAHTLKRQSGNSCTSLDYGGNWDAWRESTKHMRGHANKPEAGIEYSTLLLEEIHLDPDRNILICLKTNDLSSGPFKDKQIL